MATETTTPATGLGGAGTAGRLRPSAPTLAALTLALGYAALLAATAPAVGYTRDEGYYFKAAEQYATWWDTLLSRRFLDAFSDAEIQRCFGYNSEHPPLVKLAQGITFRILHADLGLTGAAQGFRAANFGLAALSLIATFLLGRDLVSAEVGLVAALLLAFIPRYFYDAHLACFDVPVTAFWALTVWAFRRALLAPPGHVPRRSIEAGLIFGLALATKLNALFLPPLMVLAWLHRPGTLGSLRLVPGPSGSLDLRLPRVPWALIACATLGPLVFFASWPHLWHDTFNRVAAYVAFHLHHEHYPIRYFHQVFVRPPFPWHFPWMMTALTAPSPLLVLGAVGVGQALVRAARDRSTDDLLLAGGALLPIALISVPGTPIFGGVKHWYNAMPFLAILAARGVQAAAAALAGLLPRAGRLALPISAALAIGPGIAGVVASHPAGIGYYNELAGGVRGGAALGMQRSFWGGVSRPLMPRVAALPPGTRVFFDHTNYDDYLMYLREGTLPRPIGFANTPQEAQAATLFEDREGYPLTEEAAWSSIGTRPSAGVYMDEVTLVQLYDRSARSPPPP